MTDSPIHWPVYAEAVGLALHGEPSERKGETLRWGHQGSLELKLRKGVFTDYSVDTKGHGVLDEIRQVHPDPIAWILGQNILSRDDRKRLERGQKRQRSNGPGETGFAEDFRPGMYLPGDGDGGISPGAEEIPPPGTILGADEEPLTVSKRITAIYDYTDAAEKLLYQVVRSEWVKNGERRKTFAQRRPSGAGGWIHNLDGVEHQLYRQHVLAEARRGKDFVFLCEGEKDVLNLEAEGLIATTNSGGAQAWHTRHAATLAGHRLVVLVDNDEAGRRRLVRVCHDLRKVCPSVRVLDLAEYWPDIRTKDDVSDWLERAPGASARELTRIAKGLPEWFPPALPTKFGTVPFDRLFEKPEPYKWLIKGVLPMGERILVYGEPQSGKSFMTLDLAMHIASGLNYVGHKTVQSGVFYCAFEGGKGFVIRAMVAAQHLGRKQGDGTPISVATRQVDILGNEGKTMKELIEEMKLVAAGWDFPLRLIVIDTISACTPGMNENDGAEIGRFLGDARQIIEAIGPECSVVLVHHKPKGGEGPRGSSKFTGDLETAIEVQFQADGSKDEDGRELRVAKLVKQREGERGKQWEFVLRHTDVGTDEDGDGFGACEVVYLGKAHVPKPVERGEGAKLDPRTIGLMYSVLSDLIGAEGQVVPVAVHKGQPVAITSNRLYGAVRGRDLESEDAKPGALQKKYRGWLQRLQAGGFVGFSEPGKGGTYVWLMDKRVAGKSREPWRVERSPLMTEQDERDLF